MKMIPPDASVEGASAPGFSESTFIPTVSKIPDFINQAGLNYGYGLIQSMLGKNLMEHVPIDTAPVNKIYLNSLHIFHRCWNKPLRQNR